jgi:hypothetical protein
MFPPTVKNVVDVVLLKNLKNLGKIKILPLDILIFVNAVTSKESIPETEEKFCLMLPKKDLKTII